MTVVLGVGVVGNAEGAEEGEGGRGVWRRKDSMEWEMGECV